jgi:hypothetical protein
MAIPYWDPIVGFDGVNIGNLTKSGDLFGYGDGPVIAENPWDTVIINGNSLPGLCKIKGLPTLAFDKKKGNGVDGATITVHGYLPGPIDIEVLMWTSPQFDKFLTLVSQIWRKPNKKSKLDDLWVRISHPGLDVWGINQVVILGVSVPEDGPVPQSKIIKIKAIEYVPIVKGTQVKTAKGGQKIDAPLDIHFDPAKSVLKLKPPSFTSVGPLGEPKNLTPP